MNSVAELETFLAWLETQLVSFGDGLCFPCGASASICTWYATATVEKLGGRIYGIAYESNSAEFDMTASGHDFAVLEDRFIVDGWLRYVVGEPRGVFDLNDPGDWDLIKHYYGLRNQWVECPYDEFLKNRGFNGSMFKSHQ